MFARYNGTVRLPPSPIVWRCSGLPVALVEGAGRYMLPGVNRAGLKATGMWSVEFSAAIYRGLSRLSGPGSGISGGEEVLTSTGCWFRPAPRMPLCAAPVGCFVALWYRVRLLIWPRANPLSHITPGATLQQANKAGPEGHGEQAPTARTSRSRGERIRFTMSISR